MILYNYDYKDYWRYELCNMRFFDNDFLAKATATYMDFKTSLIHESESLLAKVNSGNISPRVFKIWLKCRNSAN